MVWEQVRRVLRARFSALQRAENSSIQRAADGDLQRFDGFQCSSASRKFLNGSREVLPARVVGVSVLFSEPKIPQLSVETTATGVIARFSALQRAENSSIRVVAGAAEDQRHVSVLFSEPKIPQSAPVRGLRALGRRFSALQRAENSSIFSMCLTISSRCEVSVLFSEPKIPQCLDADAHRQAA